MINEKATRLMNAVEGVAILSKTAGTERMEGTLQTLNTAISDSGGWNNYMPGEGDVTSIKPRVLNSSGLRNR